jgi:molybdopterin-containing oxidoreductase family iron-sulfur binding subunit
MSAGNRLPVYNPAAPRHWRSLEELAGAKAVEEESAELLAYAGGLDRRDLLKSLGVSLALAGMTACTRQPAEKIVPYVRQPEEIVPGKPLFFATAMTLGGYSTGLLVESNMGRPTKAEGTRCTPSLGATDTLPGRALGSTIRSGRRSRISTIRAWRRLSPRLAPRRRAKEKGEACASCQRWGPRLWGPAPGIDGTRPRPAGTVGAGQSRQRPLSRRGRGSPLDSVLNVEKADVILPSTPTSSPADQATWRRVAVAARRRSETGADEPPYAVESMPGVTGAMADHRLPMRRRCRSLRALVAALVGLDPPTRRHAAVAEDLKAHRGTGLVLAGDGQPPAVHASRTP